MKIISENNINPELILELYRKERYNLNYNLEEKYGWSGRRSGWEQHVKRLSKKDLCKLYIELFNVKNENEIN